MSRLGAFFPIWASAPRGQLLKWNETSRNTEIHSMVLYVSVPSLDSSRFTQKWPLGAQRPPRKTCDSFNIFGDFGVILRKIGPLTFECFESMARFIGPDLSNAQFPGWTMVNHGEPWWSMVNHGEAWWTGSRATPDSPPRAGGSAQKVGEVSVQQRLCTSEQTQCQASPFTQESHKN